MKNVSSCDKNKQSAHWAKSFLQRRLHSLTGLFLVLFLFEHLLTNSQAALWIGEDGIGFVRFVNIIHSLPYLPLIECTLLGLPFLLHLVLGFFYLREAKYNSVIGSKEGKDPHFTYAKSKAYTWQRITAWVLLFGVFAHVIHLRILKDPEGVLYGSENNYLVSISYDEGLFNVLDRVGARLAVNDLALDLQERPELEAQLSQRKEQAKLYERKIKEMEKPGYLVVQASSFGTAMLLVVRDVFKNPLTCLIYTIFVLSAVYHAMNGFWTAMIAWGVATSVRSQEGMRRAVHSMMAILSFLGLSAIWLSYWVNLFD